MRLKNGPDEEGEPGRLPRRGIGRRRLSDVCECVCVELCRSSERCPTSLTSPGYRRRPRGGNSFGAASTRSVSGHGLRATRRAICTPTAAPSTSTSCTEDERSPYSVADQNDETIVIANPTESAGRRRSSSGAAKPMGISNATLSARGPPPSPEVRTGSTSESVGASAKL